MALTLKNLLAVFAAPTEVFHRLKPNPQWLGAYLLVVLASIVIPVFGYPLSRPLMLQTISHAGGLEGAQLEQALEKAKQFQYWGSLLIPLVLLIKWGALAGLLYSLAILAGSEQIRFKELFAVFVFAEMIPLLMAVVNILLLYTRAPESIHHITDLQAIIGLDVLMSDKTSDLPLFTLLNNLNVFNVWYVGVLSIGLSIMSGLGRIRSVGIVTTAWLLGVGFQVAMVMVSVTMQGLSAR